jgi:hypothetical protein
MTRYGYVELTNKSPLLGERGSKLHLENGDILLVAVAPFQERRSKHHIGRYRPLVSGVAFQGGVDRNL